MMQAALRDLLEAEDVHDMFRWLEGLIKNPFSEQEIAPVIAGGVLKALVLLEIPISYWCMPLLGTLFIVRRICTCIQRPDADLGDQKHDANFV